MDPINVHANHQEFDGFEIIEHPLQQQQVQANNLQQVQQQANNVQALNQGQPQPQPQQQADPVRQHIRELERQKNLARQRNNPQGNNQQNQQNQQQGDQPVPQDILDAAQQQAQNNLNIAQAQLASVRVLNENVTRKENFNIAAPTEDMLERAYERTGFEYSNDQARRNKMLREAEGRRDLQNALQNRINEVNQHPVTAKNLTRAKAIGYSDKYLASHYGSFNGAATDYLNLRYSLMKNRYYSILPAQELKKLSRLDILDRLAKEQSREGPDQELILFYQNLVELQIAEEQEKQRPVRDNLANPPVQMTNAEREKNASHYTKLSTQIDTNRALSAEEKARRKATMSKILVNNGNTFWQDKTDAEKKNITAAKQEGIRSILAWMYRHCDKGLKSQEPMINRIANAKPDQILHMLYLIENKMDTAPTAESFFEATNDYIPNLKVFTGRANWTRISQVAGFVLKNELIANFLEQDEREAELTRQLAPNNPDNLSDQAKDNAKLDRIIAKAHKIMRMYSAAGLQPNMPIQLIPSQALQAKIRQEVNGLVEYYNALSEELQQRLAQNDNPDQDPGGQKVEKIKNKKAIGTKNAQQHISEAKSISGHVMQANTLLKVIGEDAQFITKNTVYSLSTSGISGVLAIVGLISSIMSSVNLAKGAKTMASFDHTMKALSLTGDFIGGTSSLAKAGADVLKTVWNITSEKLPWIGRTTPLSYAESCKTLSGAIQFWAGGATILAGGLQMAGSLMNLHQANRSLEKLGNAENALDQFNQQTETLNDPQVQERRRIQSQQLKSLMDHRKDLAGMQKNTARVSAISAAITMAGGILTMTGMLAPIGGILSIAGSIMNISYGMIHARRAKRKSLKKAVDEGLKLDALVTSVKAAYHIDNLSSKEEEKLRDQVRQEALAELGYSDYKAMYLGMCKEQAEMIYRNVFESQGEDQNLVNASKEILLSLKFKTKEIYRAQHPYERNYPPLSLIYSRLTEGL